MALHLSIVADVFRHEAQAKYAIEMLRQAGFSYDQIGIAMQGHEGIDLMSDFQNLGVSREDARYYAEEVKAGNTVLSVRPDGREQEAHEIMQHSGAFTDINSVTSQTSSIDKQSTTWDQAETPTSEQLAPKMQEDFHRPRSLKPREERIPVSAQYVQAQDTALMTKQNVEEEHHEIAPADSEETLHLLKGRVQGRIEMLQPEKPGNRAWLNKGALLAGIVLGLGAGILVALLQREQISRFVLSTLHMLKVRRQPR